VKFLMAVVWKSRGDVGPTSTATGTELPLAVVEDRLFEYAYRVFFRGAEPRLIAPAATDFTYVVIEVTLLDQLSSTFDRRGYYLVLGLLPDEADFLFEQSLG
jgi:hypothetical protein